MRGSGSEPRVSAWIGRSRRLREEGEYGVVASAVLLRGGEANFPDVLSRLFMFGPAVVPGGLLFGLLLATVLLSRSTASGSREVAVLLSLAFLCASLLVAQSMALGNGLNLAIGEASVVLVGAASLLLVVAVATRPDSSFIEGLTRWSPVIIAGSLLAGAAGLAGFAVLNIPVQHIGVYEGVGPRNLDTYMVLLTLRNQGPIAVSLMGAASGAAAWRVTGRLTGAGATLLGCLGFGVNLLLLIMQSGD